MMNQGGPPTFMQKLGFHYRTYFNHHPARDGALYGAMVLMMVAYGIIAFLSPWIAPPCDMKVPDLPFKNPDYDPNPCLTTRFSQLGGLTIHECQFIKYILTSVLLGSLIGYERRAPDRAAGIRSMSLTALGACCFTICGNFTCQANPMSWDASRISASIPSGVGFLGAGIIWKGFVKSEDGGPDVHQVHGLTTAASVWLSAAIGTACGGGLYPQAIFTVVGIVLMLRFGPRNSELVEVEEEEEHGEQQQEPQGASEAPDGPSSSLAAPLLGLPASPRSSAEMEPAQRAPSLKFMQRTLSQRRATLTTQT